MSEFICNPWTQFMATAVLGSIFAYYYLQGEL